MYLMETIASALYGERFSAHVVVERRRGSVFSPEARRASRIRGLKRTKKIIERKLEHILATDCIAEDYARSRKGREFSVARSKIPNLHKDQMLIDFRFPKFLAKQLRYMGTPYSFSHVRG